MGAPVLLLALVLFPVAAAASLEPHYMVIFPAVIHHSQEEKLCIHLSSLSEAVHVAITLEVTTQNHTLVEQDVEKPGTFQGITFQVLEFIPRKINDSTSHPNVVGFLHVLIHSRDNVLFEGRKKVLVEPQKNVILIETDKGFYKPGETVKFRIVNLDEDLNIIKKEDPEYNRIAEWLNVQSRNGIVDLSFPLASEASLGEYTISVQQDMAKKNFSVPEYVLKKMEINIEHPPFITTVDEEFQLTVCGKYTYGKPIQGKTDIIFVTVDHFLEYNLSNSTNVREKTHSIETAAYILLAYVSKPDLAYNDALVSKLVHWLSGQRNAFGGFASTQDTVVSLQALAQYAALIPQEIRDVKVTVKSKEASPFVFHVHRNNKLVLHQAPLPAVPGMYTVQATGSGCVYVQTTLYYNIPPPKTEEVFVLDVETVPRECDDVRKQLDIHVSISYIGSREITNMALVEVEMLSGFIPVSSSVTALEKISLVKKTEIKLDKVTIYLEELGKTSLKLNISVEQDVEVQNLKASTVHVYDYYKPDDRTARQYVFPCSSGVSKKNSY